MKQFLRYLELGWHVIALTLLTGAFVVLWRFQTVGDLGGGDTLLRNVLLFSYSGLCLLAFHWRKLGSTLVKEWPIWLVVGIAITSAIWSQAPSLTLRRSFALLLATLYGLLFAVRYSFATVLRLLGVSMALITVASLICVALGADWAIMTEPFFAGAWQGVMFHKNALGRIAVMAIIVFGVIAYQATLPWRMMWLLLTIGAVILVIGSNAVSAMIVLLALILASATLWLATLLQAHERLHGMLLGAGFVVPIATLLFLYLPEILSLVDRSNNLTGRLSLWEYLLPIIWKQPLLGYGFGAFWLAPNQMLPLDITLMHLRFAWAGHAHNGFIDTWLEIGIAGLILILLIIFVLLYRSITIIINRSSAQSKGWFFFLFSVYIIMYNFSETMLTEANLAKSIFWITLSYTYFTSRTNQA